MISALLAAGASDAWLTPIVMKKGRPAHTLSVLVPAERVADVRREVYRQTPTIGLRVQRVEKQALDREMTAVELHGHPVAVKVARLDGEVLNVQPEFDDVATAAAALGAPGEGVDGRSDRRCPHGRTRSRLMDLGVVAIVFGAIFLVELPDKTFIAALVLSTRYKPLMVWIGVGLAFLVQTLIAVLAGHLATYLPDALIQSVALVIFLAGAFVLYRSAPGADEEEKKSEEEYAAQATEARTGFRAISASFLVLFAAEWGDLSQLLTISMIAKYGHPLSVFVGAWSALLVVSGLAVLAGRVLLRYVKLSLIHYLGAGVCLLLAVLTAYELVA